MKIGSEEDSNHDDSESLSVAGLSIASTTKGGHKRSVSSVTHDDHSHLEVQSVHSVDDRKHDDSDKYGFMHGVELSA
jgi:hypothetical protein